MALILENTMLEIFATVILLSWMFYQYFTKDFDFWKKLGVPHTKPSFPFGNTRDIILTLVDPGRGYEKFYNEFKGERYFGIMNVRTPVLVVRDPELIKRILAKDFQHFVDRNDFHFNPNEFLLVHQLFTMTGQEWKDMRHKLTPTFTSGKMKTMFQLVEKCSDRLRDNVVAESGDEVNIKSILARFTMEIIATCAFGLEIDEGQDEFLRIGRMIFEPNIALISRNVTTMIFPFLRNYISIFPPEISSFFLKVVTDTVSYRETNNVSRNDFLDILIKIRNNKKVSDDISDEANNEAETLPVKKNNVVGLTMEQMTGQAFLFLAAGFETSSSTMTFCLYELARNPDIQEKVRDEIQEVLQGYNGKIAYQSLQEMTYMEQVINETLRLYASLSILNRKCTETYKIPDSNVVLKKGTLVVIPTYAIHHDQDYYPDPYRFDPERFSQEEVKKRYPFLHLPFGDGPRMCIGNRFGMMQTKAGLATILSECYVSLTPKTQIPITLDPRAFVTKPEKPVLLKMTRIKAQ